MRIGREKEENEMERTLIKYKVAKNVNEKMKKWKCMEEENIDR